ncbi:MFS transporter [Sphingorhabdus sp. M41]|uniref:MFS transporter n=1 Tax=Sphingorhabdus sp. M41 TaxID=1806885 RepID=UPI00078E2D1A|nr:MFS transporter [Sphingorhabdus sp. M41]AMO73430.1 MFS transporter [Sphingorhabdus sp. M41]
MPDKSSLTDDSAGYEFKQHELPILPGSPANPDHPAQRKFAYLAIGLFLGLVGGAQNGFLLANTAALQGEMALTPVQAGWISVAFYSTYACMSMLLFRVRQEFGIQPFVKYAMIGLVAANFIQVLELGYYPEIGARAMAGIAASGLSALSIYYLMQGLPASARIGALVLGIGLVQTAFPLARAISPYLLVDGNISRAFQLQFGLSLISLGAVHLLRLPIGFRKKTFEKLDLPSITLFLVGVAALLAFLIQGRIQWWDASWLGWALALAISCLGGCLLIEMNRRSPMLNTSWLSSRAILSLAITGAGVRVLVAEQSFGASGLFSALGYGNEQLTGYYFVLAGATVAGSILSVVRLDPRDLTRPILFAILVIAIGAFADTRTGIMSRPSDLYWTQAAIGFAAVFAMGPVMMEGMLRALAAGPAYVISFIAVFSLSQTIGGLAGVSALSAFHTIRLKTHLIDAGATLTATNPQLASEIGRLTTGFAATISDPVRQQQAAASRISQEVGREAAVLAFNDVFFLIGSLASFAFVVVLVPWVINRVRGRNPLSKELVFLENMIARSKR